MLVVDLGIVIIVLIIMYSSVVMLVVNFGIVSILLIIRFVCSFSRFLFMYSLFFPPLFATRGEHSSYESLGPVVVVVVEREREIMLFIGKPKGRSKMISNVVSLLIRLNPRAQNVSEP